MTEAEALQRYQSLSYELNQRLWDRAELSGEMKLHAETLDTAVSRQHTSEAITVFRGGTWRLGNVPSGTEITFLGFTSTTKHSIYTKRFMLSDCLPVARFTIHCPAGTPHAPVGEMASLSEAESEILLGRRARFVVEHVFSVTTRAEIIEYVGPDPQHIHAEVWDVTLRFLL